MTILRQDVKVELMWTLQGHIWWYQTWNIVCICKTLNYIRYNDIGTKFKKKCLRENSPLKILCISWSQG